MINTEIKGGLCMAYKLQGEDYDHMNLLVECSKSIWEIMQKLGKLDADRQQEQLYIIVY